MSVKYVTAAYKVLCRSLLLPIVVFIFSQGAWGQTDVNITVCYEPVVVNLRDYGAPAGDGTWSLMSGAGTFTPNGGPSTSISGIATGEINHYYYNGPGGNNYNVYLTFEEPVSYNLLDPEGGCGDADVELTLSNSSSLYNYFLYIDGALYPDPTYSGGVQGEDGPLTWTVSLPGTYEVLGEMIGNEDYCNIWMDGTVDVAPLDLPDPYDLTTPDGDEFCEGTTTRVVLANSEDRVSYQLYVRDIEGISDEPVGGPRPGVTGSPITWNVGIEGTFYVTGTNVDSGCESEMNNDVVLTELIVPVGYDIDPRNASFCAGEGPVEVSISGSQTGVDYQLRNMAGDIGTHVEGTGNPLRWDVDESGRYSVMATRRDNQCSALMIYYADITRINTNSLAAKDGVTNYCKGEEGVTLQLSPSSQIGVNYLLYKDGVLHSTLAGTGAQLEWTGMLAGTYNIVAAKDGERCDMNNTITVVERTYTGTIDPADPVAFCLGGSSQLRASGGTTYSWAPATGLSNSSVPDPVASPTATTTYTVTITNEWGCSGNEQVTVTVHQPPVADAGSNQTICGGESAQLQATGGTGYSWMPSGSLYDPNIFNPLATPVETTTYTVTVTDDNGCSSTDQVTVTVNPLPTVNAGADKTICAGQGTTLTVTGNADSYLWSTGETNTTISVNPASTTTYTVTGTATNGCTAVDDVVVNVNPLPIKYHVTVTDNGEFCAGDPGVETGLQNSQAGIIYELYRTDNNTTIQAQTSPGGAMLFDNPVGQPGNYRIRAINTGTGCKIEMPEEVVVTQNDFPGPALSITGNRSVCTGTIHNYSIPPIAGADEYIWDLPPGALINSGAGTNNITVSFPPGATSGNLTVRGSNDCGTGDHSQANIMVSTIPAAAGAINGDNAVCEGDINILYSIEAVDRATGYIWDLPAGAELYGTSVDGRQITVDFPVGSVSGDITVTPVNNCGAGTPFILPVTVTPKPDLTTVQPDEQFDCSDKTITLSASSVTGGVSWNWTAHNGGNIIGPVNDHEIVTDSPGTYRVTVSASGCSSTDDIIVSRVTDFPENISITKSAEKITCNTPQITLTATTTSDFHAGYSWIASGGGNIVSGGGTANPVVNKKGYYKVIVTNSATSCSSEEIIFVDDNIIKPDVSGLIISVSGDRSCKTPQVQLTTDPELPAGYSSFVWSTIDGGNISDPFDASPFVDAEGTYNLTVKGTNGCTSVKPVQVWEDFSAPTNLSVSASGTINCGTSEIKLKASAAPAGVTYQWTGPPGGISSGASTAEPMVNLPGMYTVTATHPVSGCSITDDFEVIEDKIIPGISFPLQPPDLTCNTTTVQIESLTTASNPGYEWINPSGQVITGATSHIIDVTEGGLYTLRVTDLDNHCFDEETVFVDEDRVLPGASIDPPGTITCTEHFVNLWGNSGTGTVTWKWTTDDGTFEGSNTTSQDAWVSSAGNYKITVTDTGNGCTSDATVYVGEKTTPPSIINFSSDPKDLTCDRTEILLTGNATDASLEWTGPADATISNPNGSSTYVNKTGTYTLTATGNDNGCVAWKSVFVDESKDLPVNSEIDPFEHLSCINTVTTLTGRSLTADASFRWETSGGGNILTSPGNETITVGSPGTYTLFVKHPDSGCKAEANTEVLLLSAAPVIELPSETPPPITCKNQAEGITLNALVSPDESILLWEGPGTILNEKTASPTVYVPGKYTLTARHPGTGCETSASVTVGSNLGNPEIISFNNPGNVTCSNPNVTITPEISGGSFNYLWTGETVGTEINGSDTGESLVVSAGGTYRLTVTDIVNGCQATGTVIIDEDKTTPNVTADKDPSDITCTAGSSSLYGTSTTPGAIYSWDGPGNITNPGSQTPSVDQPGDYTLTVTDPANGCTVTATVNVAANFDVPPVPQINEPLQLSCDRLWTDLEINPHIEGVNYKWTTTGSGTIINDNTGKAKVNAPGTYRVTVTDRINGCTNFNEVPVTRSDETAIVEITGGPYTLNCETGSLIITGSSEHGTNPSWTTIGGNITSDRYQKEIQVNAPGEYILTVLHPGTGCPSSATVQVGQTEDVPQIDVENFPDLLTCNNLSTELYGRPVNPSHTYSWSTETGNFVSGQDSHKPVIDSPGIYVITVTNPETGCSNHSSITAKKDKDPVAFTLAQPAKLTCLISEVQLNSTITSGDTDVSYLWTTDGNGTIRPGDETLSSPRVSATGTYTLTMTNNVNGCKDSKPVVVVEHKESPQVSADQNPDKLTCENNEVILSGSSNTHGAEFYWTSDEGHTVINPQTRHPRVSNPGWYTLTVTHPESGCTNTKKTEVKSDTSVPHIHIESPAGILTCNTTSVELEGRSDTPEVSYRWSGPGISGNSEQSIINVTEPGTYYLTVIKNSTGCSSTDQTYVSEDRVKPAAPAAPEEYSCFGQSASVLNASGTNIRWYNHSNLLPGNMLATGNNFNPAVTETGNYYYYVTQTAANGCESPSTQVKYTVRGLPEPPVTMGRDVCEGAPVPDLRAHGSNIKWYEEQEGPVLAGGNYYTPSETVPGTYIFFASQTDSYGCESLLSEALLNIHPSPEPPAVSESFMTTCKGNSNPVFTAQGENITWYGDMSSSVPLSTGNEYTPDEISPGTWEYFASQKSNFGCESGRTTATLIINDLPEKFNVTGGGIFCENSDGVKVGLENSVSGTDYTLWRSGTTPVVTRPGNTGNSIDFGMVNVPGTYKVTASDGNGCTAEMGGGVSVSMNMLPGSPDPITGEQIVCRLSSGIAYEIPAVDEATGYLWELPPGAFISAGSGTRSIMVDYSATAESGYIRVRAVNSCGEGPVSENLHISVKKLPADAGPVIVTPFNQDICKGTDEEIVFEVQEIENATEYEWVLPAGAVLVNGHGSRIIRARFPAETVTGQQVVRVRGINECGSGAYSQHHNLTVYDPPVISAGDNQYICNDRTSLSAMDIPAGATANWEIFSGHGIFSNSGSNISDVTSVAMGENIFTWNVNMGACTVTDTVRVYNNRVNVDAGSNRMVCSGEITLQGSLPPPGTTGIWSVGTGSASFTESTKRNTGAFNFGMGDNLLYWEITKNGCVTRDSVIITNHGTGIVNAGQDIITCNGEARLNAETPSAGQGEWRLISGQAVFEDKKDRHTMVQGLDRGVNKLAWVVTNAICISADTVTVTNLETAISAGDNQQLCDSRFTLNATQPPAGSKGEWSIPRGSAYLDDFDRFDTRGSGLARGINKLVWTISHDGCMFRDTVTLVNNMPTTSRAGTDQDIMEDFTRLEANVAEIGTGTWSVINGSGIFEDRHDNNAIVTGLSPGPNILRWTISNENCISESDVAINNSNMESVDAGDDQIICTNETRMKAVEPFYGFGIWSVRKGSARFEDNEQANTRVYDLAPGENILRWSVTLGTIEHFDEVVIYNDTPTMPSAGPDRSICSASFTLSGNDPSAGTGIWTIEGGSANIDDNRSYNTTVSGLSPGNNIFRWTISTENCVLSDIVTITNDVPTTPDAGSDQETCDGTAWLSPNTPTTGNAGWSVTRGAGTFDGNYVSNLANGENILRYTIRNNQCSLSDEITITNFKPTTADAGYNLNVCTDATDMAANMPNHAVGEAGSWTVSSGAGTFDNPSSSVSTVRGLAPGKNVFRWTIENQGCLSFDEVEVNYDYIEANAGRDIITCDSELILNANNPGTGQGEWTVRGGSGSAIFENPNSPNSMVTNLDRGNNILRWTITNNRCVSWSDITVTNNSPSPAYAGANQTVCADSMQLAARHPITGNGYWSVINGSGRFEDAGINNTWVYSLQPGINTFRWTTENEGCISSDEVVIRNSEPANVFAGDNKVLCDDQAELMATEPELGSGMWSIIKGGGIIENVGSATSVVSGLAPDENILRWTVTNQQCAAHSDVILVNNKPTVSYAGVERTICDDNTVLEGNIPLQGTGSWSIISGAGSFQEHDRHNTTVAGLQRGRNILRWTISKEHCTSVSDVIINNDLPGTPNAGADVAVCDDFSPLNGQIPAIGTGRWSLVSGSGDFDDPDRHNTTVRRLGQGRNVLRWTVTNNNCSLSDQVEVRNNKTDVYAGPDQTVYTKNAFLSGNIPARGTGLWSLDAGEGEIVSPSSPETEVENLGQGLNTFLWSVDIDGCISTDNVVISYFPQATATFTVSPSQGCPPLDVRFTKTTADDYPFRWEIGEQGITSLEENPGHTFDNPGRYIARLFVTGPDNKEIMSERIITVHEPPVADFEITPLKLYTPGNELRTFNYSYNSVRYFWDFGDETTSEEFNPVHTYNKEGSYDVSLRVWSAEECSDSITFSKPVNVIRTTRVGFPSAFTPNEGGSSGGRYDRNDFTNHVFYPVIINGDIDNYKLQIYNRWGLKIFESDDIEIGWDGYYQGQLVSEDVYVFRVTGILNNGRKFTETGDFLLMRRR